MSKRVINAKVADIFITTGAADPKNVTSGLISLALEQLPQCRLHVVVGKAFVYKDELYELQAKNNNILLYENPPKMSEIMRKCDVAITAGGSTMYELAACGIPIIAFIYAENQRPAVEILEKEGYIINLGEYVGIKESFWNKTEKLFRDDNLRREMSEKLQKLVDGKGAERVVEALEFEP